MSINANVLLAELFPKDVMSQVFIAVHTGYNYVAKLMTTDFFNNPIGKYKQSDLKNLAVQYELGRISRARLIPFSASIGVNKRKAPHLELRNDNPKLVLTISQTPNGDALPRPAIFRQTLSVTNGQVSMAESFPGLFSSLKKDDSEIHIIITHGYRTETPKFIYVGIPDAKNKTWLGHIPIIGVIPNKEEVEETNFMEFTYSLTQRESLEEDGHGSAK